MFIINVIYARVSTEEQKTGYSIDAQLKSAKDRYASMGITDVVNFVDDGYSGEFIERPALDRLRQSIRDKTVSRIMFYDPDRMSRNLTVQLILADEIEKAGIELLFVTGDYDASPEGRLFFSMKGAISAYEKAKIRERTMSGKRAKARKGKLTFNDRALGYDYDYTICNYIINEEEAKTVKLIYDIYLSENLGTISLAIKLKAMGIKSKKGKDFSGGTVYRILKNEMYAGTKQAFKIYEKKISQYKTQKIARDPSEWIPIEVPAIVTRDQWERVQERLIENKLLAARKVKHDYLLRGKIICGHCGYAMIGITSNKKNNTYHYYSCSSKNVYKRPCDSRLLRSDEYDELVWDELVYIAENNIEITDKKTEIVDNEKIKKHIDTLRQRQSALTKWVTDGTIEIEAADQQLQTIKKEIDISQSMLKEKQPKKTTFNPAAILEAITFEQKRKAILDSGLKFILKKGDIVIDY
ncbi:recombinase family protein [Pelosinus sp. UFO1]|uniref:recombinase family protein n=1 Tax=Pelosinus sp. UFO1 TaxID=484770 RepID=UPI00130E1395|nr:recombinase family protein [Pelosinus sp. UFO1]